MSRSSALLLCLAAVATAQQEKPANVAGVVTNSLTGAPLVRAHVMCDGYVAGKQQQFGAMTDAEGKFSIQALPPGNYMLRVERVGFFMPAGAQAILRPDATSDVKLKLTPTGAILGRVLDHEGNPVEGFRIFAEHSGGNRTMTATSDHRGRYRIGGLAPGRYRVRAMPRMELPFQPEIQTDGHEDVRHIATYHPNGIDRKSATRLDVRSGADLDGVDIRLLHAPPVRVSGVVTGIPPGTPPNRVAVQTMDGRMRPVGPDGKFEIWNLDPGKSLVTARTTSGDQVSSAPLEIEVGAQHIDGLELRLVAPFDLTGQAVFEDDSAKPRPQTPNGPPPRWSLQEVSRVGGNRGLRAILMPEDGKFEFTNVPPGRYRVNIGWRASVKSVRLGSTEMENQILDLSNGTGGAPVTIVFGPASAEVAGIVRDDKGPVAGAWVVLRNTAIGVGSTNSAYTNRTAADGSYRFANVPSGKYLLVAVDEGETNPVAENYDDYEDVLVELQAGVGDKIAKDLKRHPRGGN